MRVAVEHSRRVAAFVAGCATGNLELIRAGLEDLLVEPQRQALLPVLPQVKSAALAAGALGCSFSGSGPSVFAWVEDPLAEAVEQAMGRAFEHGGLGARTYRGRIGSEGVRVLGAGETLVAA
jgi:homoserine kinase